MDIDLALLADAATVDASGKLNILGVFDRLAAPAFPVQHGRLSLVLRFSAAMQEAGAHKVGISLRTPSGADLFNINGEINLDPGPAAAGGMIRVPHIVNLDGLVFPEGGRYAFEVKVDGEHHVSVPLLVVGPGAPSAQA
jgi:hypothetical protein